MENETSRNNTANIRNFQSYKNERTQVSNKASEYGKEALLPVKDLIMKYRERIVPYLDALCSGLEAGEQKLLQQDQSVSHAHQLVGNWFRDSKSWLQQFSDQLRSGGPEDLLDFIEAKGRQHPAALFASSLIAGTLISRVGKGLNEQSEGEMSIKRAVGESSFSNDSTTHQPF